MQSEHAAERDSGVCLVELMAAFSLATDLGLGQRMEHTLRTWLVAGRLADQVGLQPDDREPLFYLAVLAWVGCVADTPEVAAWFGDDIAFRSDSFGVDFAGLPALGLMLGHVGAGRPPLRRARLAATLVGTGAQAVKRGLTSHCVTTALMADRLGLGPQVRGPLQQFFTRWDGRGVPGGVGGEQIAPAMRVLQVADVVEVAHRARGVASAVAVARARSGTQFDPAVVAAFCAAAPAVLADGNDEPDCFELVASEAARQRPLTGPQLDAALETVADFIDLRSTFRAGHSRRVASVAGRAAVLVGLAEAEAVTVRRAGLLHDIGLQGVSATILDKPGRLTATERERLRMHAYSTDRALARPAALARVGALAALVRERLDGSGYHRGLAGQAIPVTARILATADAWCAMTEPRPYRPAMTPKAAAAQLRREARAGRLASEAVDAVLAAAGQARPRRTSGPSGLTLREVEVLALIARGASTRQVARALGISSSTAGTHIERIYAKTGASTRSTATLFALQHGLLDTFEPLGSSGERPMT